MKNRGSFDSAIVFYDRARKLYKIDQNFLGVANCLRNIGSVFVRQTQYKQANENYYKSLSIYDSLHDQNGKGLVFINLANYYHYHEENLDSAYSLLNRSRKIFLEMNNSVRLKSIYNNLGNLFYETRFTNPLKNRDSAAIYYKLALKEYSSISDSINIAGTLNNIGRVYEFENMLDSADHFYNKSFAIRRLVHDKYGTVGSLLNLGNLSKKRNLKNKAKEYYEQALALAEELKSDNYVQNALINLADIEEISGDYQAALFQIKKLQEVNKKIYDSEKASQIAELQTKYETAQKEKQILAQKTQIQQAMAERQNLYFAFALALVLFGMAITFYMLRNRTMRAVAEKNTEVHRNEITQLLSVQETKAFDAMIEGQEKERKRVAEELHDRLGSTLSATKMHFEAVVDVDTNKQYVKVNELLDKAMEDTRQIAHNMLSGVLTKFGLIAALSDLKQTITAENRLEVSLETIQFDERLELEKEINLYRIVQELISNTMRHSEANKVLIRLEKKDEKLELTVSDDGKGFEHQSNGSGIGMKNITSRGNKIGATWHISSDPGTGTEAVVTLPV